MDLIKILDSVDWVHEHNNGRRSAQIVEYYEQ